ncbi:MAG: hypothetical protein ACJ76N_17370, partial [Thermoanaerobaculia bacterium]
TLLATATRAVLRFDEAHRAWSHDRRRRYLLSGPDLSLVLKHQGQFSWGEDEADKKRFLRLSIRRRAVRRVLVATSLVAALIGGAEIKAWLGQRELSLQFASWGMPRDLGEHLGQLEKLTISPSVTSLSWLSKAEKIRSLSVNAQLSTNVKLPGHLEEFTCKCSGAGRIFLNPSLRSLKLDAPLDPVLPANLRELSLSHWPRHFPPGLTSLRVVLNRLSEPADPLPAHLQSLTLVSGSFDDFPSSWAGLLPRKLKNLSLQHVDLSASGSLSWLPSDLDSLNLSFPIRHSINSLPLNLKSLSVDGLSTNLSGNLPPNLSSLSLRINKLQDLDFGHLQHLETLKLESRPFQKADMLLIVPAQLRSLAASPEILQGLRLPTGLKELRVLPNPINDIYFGNLPRGLESLDLQGHRFDWSILPPHLRSLRISLLGQANGFHLPQDLRSLTLQDLGPHELPLLESLPPRLLSLSLSGAAPLELGKLPRGLRELDISKLETPIYKNLQGLPDHLEILTLRPYSVESLQGLPKSVKELQFTGEIF